MAGLRPRKGPSGAADRNEAAYWESVKAGDFVSIRDVEAFDMRLAEGGGSDFTVGEVRAFSIRGREAGRPGRPSSLGSAPSGEYRFIELREEGRGPLYLALVEAEGPFELRLYFIPEGLPCGTRDELIDGGCSWLFLPPPDPEDFKSSELEYAPYPDVPEIEAGGEPRKYLFSPAGPGASLYGEARDTGAAVIIAEYLAEAPPGEDPPPNPLLLALEEGWIRPDGSQPEEGGYVTLLLGKVLRAGDVEHFPA